MPDQITSLEEKAIVQRAFSKQAEHYDQDDFSNPILIDWRKRVYEHINLFIKPNSNVLELNAGSGIDALHLIDQGHTVLATDNAPGMIQKINEKIELFRLENRLKSKQCSFESLGLSDGEKFDYVFSNFGGLNCFEDLSRITKQLPELLNKNAYVTWVIMPPVSLWELMWIFKGKKTAFRRFRKGGLAHLEGEFFKTYYHSLPRIKRDFSENFIFLKSEGIGALSPPPASLNFIKKYSKAYSFLKNIDYFLKDHFPFNRWADHIIVTFQFKGHENVR